MLPLLEIGPVEGGLLGAALGVVGTALSVVGIAVRGRYRNGHDHQTTRRFVTPDALEGLRGEMHDGFNRIHGRIDELFKRFPKR